MIERKEPPVEIQLGDRNHAGLIKIKRAPPAGGGAFDRGLVVDRHLLAETPTIRRGTDEITTDSIGRLRVRKVVRVNEHRA